MISLDKGILSISQCWKVITLISKRKKNINILKWRPISLLNIYYKILTKIPATRINTIIHPDQKGLEFNRYIIEIVSIIGKLETEDHPGFLYLLFVIKTLTH